MIQRFTILDILQLFPKEWMINVNAYSIYHKIATHENFLFKKGFEKYNGMFYRDFSTYSDVDHSMKFCLSINSGRIAIWSILIGFALTLPLSAFALAMISIRDDSGIKYGEALFYLLIFCVSIFSMCEITFHLVLFWFWSKSQMVHRIFRNQLQLDEQPVRISYFNSTWGLSYMLPNAIFYYSNHKVMLIFSEAIHNDGISLSLTVSKKVSHNQFDKILTIPIRKFRDLEFINIPALITN